MKDSLAWIILGVLTLMVLYTAYNCSGKSCFSAKPESSKELFCSEKIYIT